jgi:hypothetical protein
MCDDVHGLRFNACKSSQGEARGSPHHTGDVLGLLACGVGSELFTREEDANVCCGVRTTCGTGIFERKRKRCTGQRPHYTHTLTKLTNSITRRITIFALSFHTLILTSSYTASLAGFLSTSREIPSRAPVPARAQGGGGGGGGGAGGKEGEHQKGRTTENGKFDTPIGRRKNTSICALRGQHLLVSVHVDLSAFTYVHIDMLIT